MQGEQLHGLILELDEPRACVGLNTSAEEEIDGWYLDSGTTHHMTGRREFFTNLDGDVCGSVQFGDASKVAFQGINSIVFEGKNGEQWVLHGVFYIPALQSSIMSLRWLDKDGSEVRIKDGVLRIWDQRGRLMIKVLRIPNFLYIHHFNAAKPRRPTQAGGQEFCLTRLLRVSASPDPPTPAGGGPLHPTPAG